MKTITHLLICMLIWILFIAVPATYVYAPEYFNPRLYKSTLETAMEYRGLRWGVVTDEIPFGRFER